MTVKVISDQELLNEVASVLLENLSPSKVARFWAGLQMGQGDYVALREEMFAGETVETLIEKIQTYEQERREQES
jgi:N-dimethylarginine dimethylaminohydrolase